jgi:hypothetical protein
MDRSEVNPFCASHKTPFIPMSEVRGFTAHPVTKQIPDGFFD